MNCLNAIKKYIVVLLLSLTCLYSSCISINGNGYRFLTTQQRNSLKEYPYKYLPNADNKYLVELTANDVRSSFNKAEYTWIYFWIPYCTSDACKPLSYYDRILKTHEKDSVQLFLISHVYDYEMITKRTPYYSGDIYVIKDDAYWHQAFKSRKAFTLELVHNANISKLKPAHLVFKNDSLVYYSSNMTSAKLDSIIKATQEYPL